MRLLHTLLFSILINHFLVSESGYINQGNMNSSVQLVNTFSLREYFQDNNEASNATSG